MSLRITEVFRFYSISVYLAETMLKLKVTSDDN